jgi:hypothetical protein
VNEHRIRTSATEQGYTAACSCTWRTMRRTREQRDRDVTADRVAYPVTPVATVSPEVSSD